MSRALRAGARRVGVLIFLLAVSSAPHIAHADFVQQGAKLVGNDGVGASRQGFAVAISGDGQTVAVAGLNDDSNAGAVWFFTRSGQTWSQQATKAAVGTAPRAVALSYDGNTAVVGGNGAFVFTRSGSTWTQQGGALIGTSVIVTSAAVSSDGATAIVGTPLVNSRTGAASVFVRDSETELWSLQGTLVGANAYDTVPLQGWSVSLSADGNTALIGGPGTAAVPPHIPSSGTAWVFTRDPGTGGWSEQARLVNVLPPNKCHMGSSVSLSGDGNLALVNDCLVAFDYRRTGTFWAINGGAIVNNNPTAVAVSADGKFLLAGVSGEDSNNGAVRAFAAIEGWTQIGDKLSGSDAAGSPQQGFSLALSADGLTGIWGGFDDAGSIGAAWVFVQPPIVNSVAANSGSTAGGTNVTISGSLFTGATGVTFGGTAATNVVVVNDTTITATTPAHAAGAVDVVVQSSHGNGTGTGAFTYLHQSTTTSLNGTPSPSTFGEQVQFNVTLSNSSATGTVTLKADGNDIASGNVSGGSIGFAVWWLEGGAHTVTATYSGDTIFAASTSSDFSHTVSVLASSTALGSSANPSTLGQSVTFTATVSASTGTPAGQVTFKEGTTVLGTVALSGGGASLSTSALGVGTHNVRALYGGSANHAASTSSIVAQKVNKGVTTTSVNTTPNPSKPGQSVTITANVAVTAPAPGSPTGTVTFKNGTKSLGSAAVSAGQASITTSKLTTGMHTINASYGGNATLAGSSSSTAHNVDPRIGAEFRVNSATANAQQWPAVARLAGGFVVVWQSNGQDGSGLGVYGQRYNAAGVKVGGEFRVNNSMAGDQSMPAVAGLKNGGFVVAWQSSGQDGAGLGIYARRYDKNGAAVGNEFLVNTTTANHQSMPAVAGLAGGPFVIAWQSTAQDGSGLGIYAQRYTAAGAKAGAEFRVNTTTAMSQSQPVIAALTGGGFVVAWQSDGQDGSGLGIYGKRYAATGAPVGSEFRANAATADDQSMPAVTGLDDGGFVVAWQSDAQDGDGLGIYARRFNVNGAPRTEFRVNTTTANDQSQPSVAGFQDDGFAVAWTSQNQDGSGRGVYAQGYNAAGKAADIEFLVNTTISNNQWQPSAAAFADGKFVVVWTSRNQDGSLEGVYGQLLQVMSIAP